MDKAAKWLLSAVFKLLKSCLLASALHWARKEIGMSEHAYLLTAAIVFLLIAVAQLISLLVLPRLETPAWPSFIAFVVTAFLSYEGFHFARRAGPKT